MIHCIREGSDGLLVVEDLLNSLVKFFLNNIVIILGGLQLGLEFLSNLVHGDPAIYNLTAVVLKVLGVRGDSHGSPGLETCSWEEWR